MISPSERRSSIASSEESPLANPPDQGIGRDEGSQLIGEISSAAPSTNRSGLEQQAIDILSRVGDRLMPFSDPETLLQELQSRGRNQQLRCREHGIRSEDQARTIASNQREVQRERAEATAKQGDFWGDLGDALGVAAAIIGAIASVVSCVVTGPAGLVGAAGILIAVVGPYVVGEMAKAGTISADAAPWVSMVVALVGTVLSFGAGLAAGGVAVSAQALNTGLTAAQTVVSVGESAANMGAAHQLSESQHATADATAHGNDVSSAIDRMEESQDEMGEVARTHQRLTQLLAEIQNERAQARSIALRS